MALEGRVEADVSLGLHAEVTGELERLVAEHPLRERFHGQLMLALYQCGRQAEALAAYSRARDALISELGVEPGPGLRELHQPVTAGPVVGALRRLDHLPLHLVARGHRGELVGRDLSVRRVVQVERNDGTAHPEPHRCGERAQRVGRGEGRGPPSPGAPNDLRLDR